MHETITETRKAHQSPVSKPRHTRISRRRVVRIAAPMLTPLILLAIWQLITAAELYPAFIIPPPAAVWESFLQVAADGTLWRHVATTLHEMLLGLLFGVGSALLLGYVIAKSKLLGDILSPVIVAMQSAPTVAYAPLLIIWFGSGITSKVVTAAIIVFFPALMNVIVGIRSVPDELHDLMRSLRATRWQILTKLEIPASLPVLLTGLKTSVTLSVIGAVVGEFIAANSGLGFLVKRARDGYDTPLVIVAVLTMTALALILYSLVSLLERYLLRWQR